MIILVYLRPNSDSDAWTAPVSNAAGRESERGYLQIIFLDDGADSCDNLHSFMARKVGKCFSPERFFPSLMRGETF